MNLSNTIRNILKSNGVSFRENGKSFILDCLKCGKREKLYIRKTNGGFICFTCGARPKGQDYGYSGRVEVVLSDLLNVSIDEARQLLDLDNFSGEVFEETAAEVTTQHKNFPPSVVPWYHPLFQKAEIYLAGRGVNLDLIKFYNIHYDYASKRVIFPVMDEGGIIGWTDRIILPDEKLSYINKDGEEKHIPKSLHNFDKSHYLLFNDLWPDNAEHLILAEGPISAIKAYLCQNTVASMGKIISNRQIEIIQSRGIKRLYLGLDPDAYEDIEKLIKRLYGRGIDLYLLPPSKGKQDLGDCSPEEVYDVFRSCNDKLTPSHIILI